MFQKKTGTLFVLFILMFMGPKASEAIVYLTTDQALKLAFPEAESIDKVSVILKDEQKLTLEKRAGTRLRFSRMTIYAGMKQGKPMSYAMIHNVKGKARPITFMAVIDPRGAVQQVEILAYRESHGGEIRYPSFLKQFFGKDLSHPIRHKQDIRNISGATISCRAISDGVRTLLALWEMVYGQEAEATP